MRQNSSQNDYVFFTLLKNKDYYFVQKVKVIHISIFLGGLGSPKEVTLPQMGFHHITSRGTSQVSV